MSGAHLDEELLAGLAAAPIAERLALAPHLERCETCRARVAEVVDLLGELDAWQVPPPTVEALGNAREVVLAAMALEADPLEADMVADGVLADGVLPRPDVSALSAGRAWPSMLATFVGGAALAAVAKQHSGHLHDWVEAGAALALAVGLAYFARASRRFGAVGFAVGASFVLALVGAALPGLSPAIGLKCFLFELATATLPGAVAWRAGRRGEKATIALAAAAGALAGMAALHVACPVHEERAHLVVFHVGGVVVAGLLGALIDWRRAALGSAAARG